MSAIKIPSKRIYNNEHSLAKNQISKVDAKVNKLNFEKDFDAVVGSRQIDISESYKGVGFETFVKDDFGGNIAGTSQNWIYGEMRRNSTITTYFDKIRDDGKSDVVSLVKDQPAASVYAKKTTKTYEFNEGELDYTTVADSTGVPTEEKILELFPNKSCSITEEDVYEIPQTYEEGSAKIDWGAYPTQSATFEGNKIKSEVSYYRVYAKIRSCNVYIIKNAAEFWVTHITYVEYVPKELSFSVKGDIEKYVPAESNEPYGEGEDYYSIETNELMLDVATINGVPVTQVIAENIIDGFKDGKETYSLVCSIGDYYDEDGALAISSNTQIRGENKMMFDIGDTVIPYKPSAAGDVVISSSADGTFPKMFKVVGVTPIFDGAVWQKLDLLETNVMKKNVIVEAMEERTETVVSDFPDFNQERGSYTTTMNISLPSNVDFVKINGARISGERLIEDMQRIDDTNTTYTTFASFVDGVLSIRTVVVTSDVSSGDEDGEFLCEFAEVPEREYLFELHMS